MEEGRLVAFRNAVSEGKVAIFMHRTPDPDAMASAAALQWLFGKWEIESTIFYEGEISHPQNTAMANLLGITMSPLDDYKPANFSKTVCVDFSGQGKDIKFDAIIDHHRVAVPDNTSFVCVEPVGAAATLVWEMIEESGIKFEDDMDGKIATALFFGIRIDTQDLISEAATDRDYAATRNLLDHIDRGILNLLVNYPIPQYYFDIEKVLNQEGNSQVAASTFVGCIDIISPAKRDALPMVADKMVRLEGIETSIVFALIGDHIEASVRSQNPSLDVSVFFQKIFGKEYSGGKLGAGAARVPLGIMGPQSLPDDVKMELWEVQKKVIFHKILHVVSRN